MHTARIRMLSLAGALLALCLAGSAYAGLNSLTPIGFDGGVIERLVSTPGSRRVYLHTEAGDLYVMDESATSPRLLNVPQQMRGFVDVHANGALPEQLLLALTDGFGRSNDGGESWQFISTSAALSGGALLEIASFRMTPSTLVVSTANGVYRSLDDGSAWAAASGLPPRAEATVLSPAPGSSTVIYAGLTQRPEGLGTPTGAGIYKSTDGGLNWTSANGGLPSSLHIYAIAVDPRSEQTVYAGTDGGLFKSADGGASWTEIEWLRFYSHPPTNGLVLDDSNPDIVYASSGKLMARSTDAGATWTDIHSSVITGRPTATGLAMHPGSRHTLLIATSDQGLLQFTMMATLWIGSVAPSAPDAAVPKTIDFLVGNDGPFSATEVRTVIEMPASAVNISVSPTDGECSVQGSTINCTQPILRAAADRVTIRVTSTHTTAAEAEIRAHVEASEPNYSPDRTTLSGAPRRGVTSVSARIMSPGEVLPAQQYEIAAGQPMIYRVRVQNIGPNIAHGVIADIHLPGGIPIASVSTSQGSCSSQPGRITCSIGDIEYRPMHWVEIVITTGPLSPGVYRVEASASTTSPDYSPDNNSDYDVLTVVPSLVNTGSNAGGSGGGGSMGWMLLLALAGLGIARASLR